MVAFQRKNILPVVLACLTTTGLASAADDAGVAAGEALAKVKCAACHAIGIAGTSSLAKATPLRDFAIATAGEKHSEALDAALAKRHGQLVKLTPEDLRLLVVYLGHLKNQNGLPRK